MSKKKGCGCPSCNPLIKPKAYEETPKPQLTLKERIAKQRLQNHIESEECFARIMANSGEHAAHRARVLAERGMAKTGYLDGVSSAVTAVKNIETAVDNAVKTAKETVETTKRAAETAVNDAKQAVNTKVNEVKAEVDQYISDNINKVTPHSLQQEHLLEPIENPSFDDECTLQEELEKNHQAVLILTEEDAFYSLKNILDERYQKSGEIPSTLILKDIDKAKTWIEYIGTGASAVILTQAFGDLGVRAKYSTINGKVRISISTRANGPQMLRHVLVNGMRIKVNGTKTYAIDNPKVVQLGLAPKDRLNAGIKAGAMTMIISAAINTNDLIFNDDYDFYDWFGNVGTDFIKTALAIYGAEFVVGTAIGFTGGIAVILIALASITLSVVLDYLFEVKNVSKELTNALRQLQE